MAENTPLGEFELIERLAKLLPKPQTPGAIGIGDDAAAVPFSAHQSPHDAKNETGMWLLTCDAGIAGRHFIPGTTPMDAVGWRVATANVSDVVACGGKPRWALVSLGVPAGVAETDWDDLYRGLAQAAGHYGFDVLGGNVTGADTQMVDVFMVGETKKMIPRSGVRPGDLIVLSGPLGESSAGLTVMTEGLTGEAEERLRQKHLYPQARLDLVDFLQEVATAAIDISDGLASELGHLAEASGVALEIEESKIPVSSDLAGFCNARAENPLERILHGGEDYEILFALSPDNFPKNEKNLHVIGEARAGSGVRLSGKPLPPKGWNHLKT